MNGILAIETATEACSVAVQIDGEVKQLHKNAPRQHSQLLFGMLQELLPGGNLRGHGVGCIALGNGPGSFTGLRIAATAVQGLAFAANLPVAPVSTLACLAQTALRTGQVGPGDSVLCSLDARINEVYSALYEFEGGLAVLREGPWAVAPEAHRLPAVDGFVMAGSGAAFYSRFPAELRQRAGLTLPDLLPEAQDLLPHAVQSIQREQLQSPLQVQPVYVRDEISWKKLAEQGPRA